MNFLLDISNNVDFRAEIVYSSATMELLWEQMRADWLDLSYARSESQHTRAAYDAATRHCYLRQHGHQSR